MKYLWILCVLLIGRYDLCLAQEVSRETTHLTSRAQVEILSGSSLGAAGSSPRKLLMLALDLIKDFESWEPHAYDDASLYCTIGYGHLIALKACAKSSAELAKFIQPLSVGDGLELLDKDTAIARVSIQQLVHKSLSDEQFGAVASFVFNVGTENFAKSRLLSYLNNEEYDGAAKQFARWVKSKGKILPGLLARRNCEAALFTGKLISAPGKMFNRDECSGLGAAPSVEDLVDIEVGEQ